MILIAFEVFDSISSYENNESRMGHGDSSEKEVWVRCGLKIMSWYRIESDMDINLV